MSTMVYESKSLTKTFGSKSEKVTRDCEKFHIEEHHVLYSSQNITRVIVAQSFNGTEIAHFTICPSD